MSWVLDSSVALAWCFEDERTPWTEDLLNRITTEPAVVPQIWPLEIANVLTLATRRNRINQKKQSELIHDLLSLPIRVDLVNAAHVLTSIVPLAEAHGLTSYDASYLELALRLGFPLATLDQPLRVAAQACGLLLP